MQKPDLLRAALVAAYPQLARDADRLTMWVEKGRIHSPMTASHGFELAYTLNITITECVLDPAVIFFAITEWLRAQQPELLAPDERHGGFTFEADLIDLQTVDLMIVLDLAELVTTATDASGNPALQYVPEPDFSWLETGGAPLATPTPKLVSIVAQEGTPPADGG